MTLGLQVVRCPCVIVARSKVRWAFTSPPIAFKEIYFAERPPCERLENRKLELRNLNLMQDWREALKQYINQYYQGYLDKQ